MFLQVKAFDLERFVPFLSRSQIGVATAVFAGVGAYYVIKKLTGSSDKDIKKLAKSLKARKTQIIGLNNVGNSCFLNSLIQCLAASTELRTWLEEVCEKCPEALLPVQLLDIIRGVNGEWNDRPVESVDPSPVLHAMRRHGWVIRSTEEQDCHELFHVLFSTIEEEIAKSVKNNIEDLSYSSDVEETADDFSLETEDRSDVIDGSNLGTGALDDLLSSGADELKSQIESKETGDLISSSGDIDYDSGCCSTEDIEEIEDSKAESPFLKLPDVNRICSYGRRSKGASSSENGHAGHDMLNRQKIPHSPFKGGIVSQRTCLQCGFKTPLRYDAFESISLLLSTGFSLFNPVMASTNLQQLLNSYFEPESVSGADCEGCKDKPVSNLIGKSSLKRQYIAKLPKFLCLHIQRNFWTEFGTLAKRTDFVEFPEFLNMGRFTLASEIQAKHPSTSNMGMAQSKLYRLVSVAVHSGDAFSGHFFAYRLGPGSINRRWYLASDASIRKASVADVLSCSAYMLFYEKI